MAQQQPSGETTRDPAPTAELREVIRRRDKAYEAGDAAGYLSVYAEDATIFFERSPLTLAEMCREIVAIFAAGGGVITLQLEPAEDILLSDRGDAATATYTWRERFRNADGTEADNAYFETDVWYRRADAWKLVRVHLTRTGP